MKRFFAFICLIGLLASCSISYGSPRGREAAGPETFTLMWYVNGSDLESGSADDAGGAFSDNLEEMLSALPPDENFRVALFTGGAREWKTAGFSSEWNQAHVIDRDGLTHGPVLPEGSIAEPETLARFIQWSLENCPARRYGLVFWDHGSGVPIGFGYDELREPRYMDLTAMAQGLEEGLQGRRLAFIGFDTCLMATVETAAACAPFADTLIASEELEPFGGWDYAPLMWALGNDPGMDMETLGKAIINGYFLARKNAQETLTLSMTDLSLIGPVVEAVSELAGGIKELLDEGGFTAISRLRSRVKYYGGVNQSVDMVDLVHLASRLKSAYPDEAERLVSAVKECVILNQHTANAPNSHGLSIYFPYENEGIFKNYLDLYLQCGFSEPYIEFVRDFTKQLEAGDASLYMIGLKPRRTGETYTVSIPREWGILKAQWALTRREGYGVYLLLGLDDGVMLDEATGEALGVPPKQWLTVDGNPAFAYRESGDEDSVLYSVLAELDGRKVNLIAAAENGTVTFLGAVPEAQDGRVPLPIYRPIEMGDTVTLLYPKLDTRRPGHEEEFFRGPSITVERPLAFALAPVDGVCGFFLTDCYHNQYVTDVR